MNFKQILFAVVLSVVITSCQQESSKGKSSVRSVKCDTVRLDDCSLQKSQFAGKVTSASEVKLSFRVAGVIEKVNVKQGDYVKKGQLLAQMDPRDYQLQYDATLAEYNAIRAEAERVIALYEKNSTTKNNYDKAVSGLERITIKKESHYNALQDTKLVAPYSGYIQEVYFDAHQAVSAGLPVVEFISSQMPEIEVNLPLAQYRNLDKLSASTLNLEDTTTLDLEFLAATYKANLNQLYTARFAVRSSIGDLTLTPGMSSMVTLDFDTQEVPELLLPLCAIVETGGQSQVWVIGNDGAVAKRNIEVKGVRANGMAEIESGVAEGEVVVTAGVNSIKEGQRVKPLEMPTKSNVG